MRLVEPEGAKTVARNFWRRVDRTSGADACWPWTGATQGAQTRRGRLRVNGQRVYAYRFAYELENGPIPPGLMACHACDNPNCVNPSHIFLGVQADNMSDAASKGRLNGRHCLQGEAHPCSRNPDLDVIAARRLRAEGATYREIAALFGVGKTTAARWVNGQSRRNARQETAA